MSWAEAFNNVCFAILAVVALVLWRGSIRLNFTRRAKGEEDRDSSFIVS